MQKRREFIQKTMATGFLSCFGINFLFSNNGNSNLPDITKVEKHKFQNDSGMTYQAIFNFAYKSWFIPFLKTLSEEIGNVEFIELLKKAAEKRAENIAKYWLNQVSSDDFKGFKEYIYTSLENNFMQQIGTFEISEESENAIHLKCTECLWAKTFREEKASEIGYACTCHQDFAMAESFNPKIKLEHQTKSLMEGGEACNLKWVYQA